MAVQVPANLKEDQRLRWLREQRSQLEEAATAARALADRHRPRVEQARQVLVELEHQLSQLEADNLVRLQRVVDFKEQYPDV